MSDLPLVLNQVLHTCDELDLLLDPILHLQISTAFDGLLELLDSCVALLPVSINQHK